MTFPFDVAWFSLSSNLDEIFAHHLLIPGALSRVRFSAPLADQRMGPSRGNVMKIERLGTESNMPKTHSGGVQQDL